MARHRDTCRNATGRGLFQHHHRRLRPIGCDHRALAIRLLSHFDLSTLADGRRTAMKLDPAIVARVQFAFTVSFHIIFPTISIGLAIFLAIVEGLWLKTKERIYLQIYRFW